MVGTGLKVLIADAVLLIAEYFAILDVQARVGCALGSPLYGSQCLTRASPGYSYGLLTESFSMFINGAGFVSPTMLDWVQVLAFVLVLVNGWFTYRVLKSRASREQGVKALET
jgi:hypothetical protein